MKITTNVDLPLELIEAQEADELVLFVGAGASKSAPANLPDFFGLAEQLGRYAHAPSPTEKQPLDQYLGTLSAKNFNVHQHTHKALHVAGSEPNDTHRGIVALALASEHPRIITTNFDTLLNQAWSSAGAALNTWAGPALPLGDEFSGIVQIHGSLDSHYQNLVLTDADFGKAYVTKNWASRFLVDVFNTFTVLFIGYSHQDPIMRYLAHGLPSNTSRFALLSQNNDTDSAKNKKFMEDFGITVVGYPSANGHAALPEVLHEWARRSRLDKLGLRQETEEILRNLGDATPGEIDFLLRQLITDEGVQDFTTIVSKLKPEKQNTAYQWMRQQPIFQNMFNRTKPVDLQATSERVFEKWIAQHLTIDSKAIFECWRCIAEFGSLLRYDFFELLLRRTLDAVQGEIPGARSLAIYLRTSIPGITSPLQRQWLDMSEDDWDFISEVEFAQLLEPRIKLNDWRFRFPAFSDQEVSFIPDWDIRSYELELGLARMHEHARMPSDTIYKILENSLRRAQRLLDSVNPANGYDVLSSRRLFIGDSEHNYSDFILNPIVDYLRDHAREQNSPEPLVDRWWDSGVLILQRLAIHSLSYSPGLDAEEKIRWVMNRPMLIHSRTHTAEVYDLLGANIGALSVPSRQELLDSILQRDLSETDEEYSYQRHKRVRLLLKKAPEWTEASEALAQLESAFPDLAHPDEKFSAGVISSTDLEYEPRLLQDFQCQEDRHETLQQFFERAREDSFYTEEILQRECRDLVTRDPVLALDVAVASSLIGGETLTGRFISNILLHLEASTLSGHSSKLKALAESVSDSDGITAVARAILKASERELPHQVIDVLEQAIDVLWDENISDFTGELQNDLSVSSYLNDWPGILVNASVRLIFTHWQNEKDSWAGFPDTTKKRLEKFLSADGYENGIVAQALTVSLLFLLKADKDFTVDKILPLFSQDGSTRKGAWLGYLISPFYAHDYPVADIVLDLLRDGWIFLAENENNSEIPRRFFPVIGIAIKEGVYRPEIVRDLLTAGITRLPENQIISFIEYLGSILDSSNGSTVWDNGIRDFVEARIEGKPVEISVVEQKALVELPTAAPRFATEIFSRLGNISHLPIDKIPRFLNLAESPIEDQETIAESYLSRLRRNRISQSNALQFLLRVKRTYEKRDIPPKMQMLMVELEAFV